MPTIRELFNQTKPRRRAGRPLNDVQFSESDGGFIAQVADVDGVDTPIVFPTVVEEDGELVELGEVKARKKAVREGNFAQFRTLQDAQSYSF